MNAERPQQDTNAAASGDPAGEETMQPGAEAPLDIAALGEAQVRQLISALQDENEKLRADFEAERDQHLRTRAEMENFRRRMEREKADTAKYAIGKFAGDVVGVADNFERAIKSVPEGATADNPGLQALLEGVVMTEREFLVVLERHGVTRVTPFEQPFNPHLHQAVMEMENPAVPAGTCVQVFQHGYTIEDRVLRPAMVAVSRGGPKAQKPSEAGGNAASHSANAGAAGAQEPGAGPGEGASGSAAASGEGPAETS